VYLADAARTPTDTAIPCSDHDVDGGQIIGPMGTPTPHPDGSRVAFQYSGGLYQINLDGSGFGKLYENTRIA
jgi:hypothetical protein